MVKKDSKTTKSRSKSLEETIKDQRTAALNSFEAFIRLVAPHFHMFHHFVDLARWWYAPNRKKYQMVLLPRDHGKSQLAALRVAYELTKNPAARVIYLSATANLAIKQLDLIKQLLTSEVYRTYFPDMVNKDPRKRKKWTQEEISVDHPLREQKGIRDPSVFCAGLGRTVTGMHCDILVMDDVVVWDNTMSEENRNKLRSQYSLYNSIRDASAQTWVVGTRYHPDDLYDSLINMEYPIFDKEGNKIDHAKVFDVYLKNVETIGDGTGEYLFPRQQIDGQWYGFDIQVLAEKKATYIDLAQFQAQYYNNPNAGTNNGLDASQFQYYDRKFLVNKEGDWFFKERKLNIYAAVDFAFSLASRADWTAIVVIGVDYENNIYVLDTIRFKAEKIGYYIKHIRTAHAKWQFKKLRAEVTVAQSVIVKEIKNVLTDEGHMIRIEEFRPNRHEGTKDERIVATLHAKYDNGKIWHYRGGDIQELELELVQRFPKHDDLKDALASAVTIAIPPSKNLSTQNMKTNVVNFNRFGGY